MLKVYCITPEDKKLYLETEDHAEAIQFIKVLVSLHGYDTRFIKSEDDKTSKRGTLYGGYSGSEYCYIEEVNDEITEEN